MLSQLLKFSTVDSLEIKMSIDSIASIHCHSGPQGPKDYIVQQEWTGLTAVVHALRVRPKQHRVKSALATESTPTTVPLDVKNRMMIFPLMLCAVLSCSGCSSSIYPYPYPYSYPVRRWWVYRKYLVTTTPSQYEEQIQSPTIAGPAL